ncbi:hypothetical protein AVEN_128999-1 [Araneus ventricosus]|uniref:Uncharacterized protein n=1 Tax=Araneus ventricosus TaxID=182803 RepID=A0A4Y2GB11_ARAVE|nr:hypothetical protein AVEN_128999-1 [Araneus ventricosus]
MEDRTPRQHSQAPRYLHYSPHYKRLIQKPTVLPGYERTSEMVPKTHTTIIVPSDWRESTYLYGSLSSVNSRCPLPDGLSTFIAEKQLLSNWVAVRVAL